MRFEERPAGPFSYLEGTDAAIRTRACQLPLGTAKLGTIIGQDRPTL
jgi:hypothetical protein